MSSFYRDPVKDFVDLTNPIVNDIVTNAIGISIDYQKLANLARCSEDAERREAWQARSDMWLCVAQIFGEDS